MATFTSTTLAGQALREYEKLLRVRQQNGKTSVRSIRLALTPAVKLLMMTSNDIKKTLGNLPEQDALDRYLLKCPGQQAAITGFINYLNDAYSLTLMSKVNKRKTRKFRRKKLEEKLLLFLRDKRPNDTTNLEQWVLVAIEYFHDIRLTKRELSSVLNTIVSTEHSGISLKIANTEYYLPLPNLTHK